MADASTIADADADDSVAVAVADTNPDSLTHHPASCGVSGKAHPCPFVDTRLLGSFLQRSSMPLGVQPSPRNSMQARLSDSDTDHTLSYAQLPITVVAVAAAACACRARRRRSSGDDERCVVVGFGSLPVLVVVVVNPRSMAALWAPLASHSWAYGQRNWGLNLARVGWSTRTGGWWEGNPWLLWLLLLVLDSVLDVEDAAAVAVADAMASAADRILAENFIVANCTV
mmetsp:Transcript_26860/g.56241  ORF Transcript_26860/g.56241 Transcript_26860/m.56241 type:complete len:228 (-) Transcript_26860:94-777(-)